MTAPRVCAVVVTFNRLGQVRRCLAALAGQTRPPERILVVDNHSTDGTATHLTGEPRPGVDIKVLPLPENLGPAGGFAAGFEAALRSGCSHVWAMDDDVLPMQRCLEKLVSMAQSEGSELLFPAVVDLAGRSTSYPGWSGVLISTEAIRRAGVPKRDLFWWIEDTEYLQWRLPNSCGITPRRCSDARVEHGADRSGPKPSWKFYYEARNTVFYRLHIQTSSRLRRASRIVVVLTKAVLRTLLLEDQKAKKLSAIACGIRDGLLGRLGKTLDPMR